MNSNSAKFQRFNPKECREIGRTKVKKIADAAQAAPTRLYAHSQTKFGMNSQSCEFHSEFAANLQSERLRSEFAEFKSNSPRICIPTVAAHVGCVAGGVGCPHGGVFREERAPDSPYAQ